MRQVWKKRRGYRDELGACGVVAEGGAIDGSAPSRAVIRNPKAFAPTPGGDKSLLASRAALHLRR